MGKGSNVQKAQAARERNQKKMGKSPEERAEAAAKAKVRLRRVFLYVSEGLRFRHE